MRPEPHLGALIWKTSRRALRLRELIRYRTLPLSTQDEQLLSYVTIEGLNLWTMFARCYFLSSALKARTSNGPRVVIAVGGINTQNDALTFAVYQERPRFVGMTGPWAYWQEPTWRNPVAFDRVMAALKPSNLGNLRKGLAYPTTALDDLPVFRNYYAHKGRNTALQARSIARKYALSPAMRPSELLCSRGPGRPQSLLADWLDDVRNIVELMD
jgi:hypothetical protein